VLNKLVTFYKSQAGKYNLRNINIVRYEIIYASKVTIKINAE